MNKENIRQLFVAQIKSDLDMLTQSALAAKAAAIHTESKAEDQYDTRGLEASYLAGAQSARVAELEGMLAQFRNLDLGVFDGQSVLRATALVELKGEEKSIFCWIMPQGGGRSVQYEGMAIQVVTPQSPLGEALMGKKQGDEVEVRTQTIRDYEIVRVW